MQYALITAIDNYLDPANNLQGCVNDAQNFRSTIAKISFGFFNEFVIKNQNATKQEILDSLSWFIRQAKTGDSVVFYYSGHGSQVPDMNGDEIDKLDEILCPYDFSWATKTYITDDEIGDILKTAKDGVVIDIILDCCHSGTATREPRKLFKKSNTKRFIRNPDLLSVDTTYKKRRGLLQKQIEDNSNHTLWSACRSDEVSMEMKIDGKIQGYFTNNFCEVLNDNPTSTRGQIYKKVQGKMGSKYQHPALYISPIALTKKIFT